MEIRPLNAVHGYSHTMVDASRIARWLGSMMLGAACILPAIATAENPTAENSATDVASLRREIEEVRRSSGLYDMRQYDLLWRVIDAESQSGDVESASADLVYLQRLSAQGHGQQSVQYAKSMAEVARWQCRIGQFMQSRQTFRSSIELLERNDSIPELVTALRGFADCCMQELAGAGVATRVDSSDAYRGPIVRSSQLSPTNPAFRTHVYRFLRVEAEDALKRAVQLSSALDSKIYIDVLLQSGDWFLTKDYVREARRLYIEADTVARRDGVMDALAVPEQVLYATPPTVLRTRHLSPDVTEEDFVEVEFTVRADGRIIDEKVIDHGPGKTTVVETLESLRAARFRPRIVEGRALTTEGVRFRQTFRRRK